MVTEETSLLYEAQGQLMETVSRCNGMGIKTMSDSGASWPIPVEKMFETILEVQSYVDRLQADPAVQSAWPRKTRRIIVEEYLTGRESEGVYQRTAEYRSGRLRLPPHGAHGRSQYLRELWVLHELAHYYDSDKGTSRHGPGFVHAYTTLISAAMDPLFGMYARLRLLRDIDELKRN